MSSLDNEADLKALLEDALESLGDAQGGSESVEQALTKNCDAWLAAMKAATDASCNLREGVRLNAIDMGYRCLRIMTQLFIARDPRRIGSLEELVHVGEIFVKGL